MTESSRAVFLSYASQDAEAARHICEALQSAGIEVWFDQVVIDDTKEQEAEVPEAFRAVQWTRLPDGQTAAAFTERVLRLLTPQQSRATVAPPARVMTPSRGAVRASQPFRPAAQLIRASDGTHRG